MSNPFHVIIPARYASVRLPKKLLLDLGGCAVLERTYRQALGATPASITIATEHEEIREVAEGFGATVMMTCPSHESGTSRAAEVVEKLGLPDDAIVVNLQGDEPFMPSDYIRHVAKLLEASTAPMGTLVSPVRTLEAFHNPSIVKVVLNAAQEALYFSRSPIPFCRDNPAHFEGALRHFGIYAYRAWFLAHYPKLSPSPFEQVESLEQLRALWHGYRIAVGEVERAVGLEINTQEELEEARALIQS